jgi:hypothetical protein
VCDGRELIVPHAAIQEAVVEQQEGLAFSPDLVVALAPLTRILPPSSTTAFLQRLACERLGSLTFH